MSVWAQSWAFEQQVSLSGAKFVLVALASFANEQGECYPSQETISAMTGICVRSVRSHLKDLESQGFIARTPRRDVGGKYQPETYTLQAPADRLRPSRRSASDDSPSKQTSGKSCPRQRLPEANSADGKTEQNQRQILSSPAANSADPLTLPYKDEPSIEPLEENRKEEREEGATSAPAPPSSPEKSPKRSTNSATRIPEDFAVSAPMRDWASREVPGFDVDRETEKFCDYWLSAPGAKGRKENWVATWRIWMRRAYDDAATRASPPPPLIHRPSGQPSNGRRKTAQEERISADIAACGEFFAEAQEAADLLASMGQNGAPARSTSALITTAPNRREETRRHAF